MVDMSYSVVIATHNRPELFYHAARSALTQMSVDSELICIDDGDVPVLSVLENLTREFPRKVVKYFKNTARKGPSGARNFGVDVASGEYIFFLDDDDVFNDGYIESCIQVIRENPDILFGFTNPYIANDRSFCERFDGALIDKVQGHLWRYIFGMGCGFWIKKSTYTNLGGLDVSLMVAEDQDLAIRLYLNRLTGVVIGRGGVIVYRQHVVGSANITQIVNSRVKLENHYMIFSRYYLHRNFRALDKMFFVERLVRRALKGGQIEYLRGIVAHEENISKKMLLKFFMFVKMWTYRWR